MLAVRWTPHALESLEVRAIQREEAEKTLQNPARTVPGEGGRTLFLRRYHDAPLGREMLMCVVTEAQDDEVKVITVYKTSKIEKYLGGGSS
jgi:hypothetical protein